MAPACGTVDLLARIAAGLLGGYALAAWASVAALALPTPTVDGVLAGMLLSFAVHGAAAIWAFAARSPARAWLGLLLAALLLLPAVLLGASAPSALAP